MTRSLVVVGTGAFALGLCQALARTVTEPTTVYVTGRSTQACDTLCAQVAESAPVSRALFRPVVANLSPGTDLRPVLASLAPQLAVVCASYQSPKDVRRGGTEWSRLVRAAGFGVTLPLQAALADLVAVACQDSGDTPVPLVNACFPDAVNALLHARGRAVLGGVGNVATLSAELSDTLAPGRPERLKLLAHHVHLHGPDDPAHEARCWLDHRPLSASDTTTQLEPARTKRRSLLNDRGATAAADLVGALLDGRRYVGHVPGPAGLVGGYPVTVESGRVTLRLPPGVSTADAQRWNEEVSRLDGGWVDSAGTFRLTDRAAEAVAPHLPELTRGCRAEELTDLCARQLRLRERLQNPVPS
ncbi:hypothetical protein ABZ307_42050 [Streptomyces griseorubiginosus]|uniref:hypothetical protein n=1 Tax=Streptomyces griseorubiginosus TaxID=67304 RepID=UPI0033B76EE6